MDPLQRLLDIEDIRGLKARYFRCMDTKDWEGLAKAVALLRATVPALQLVLAGGLRENNVASAIRLLNPEVVDVSSGVETAPGVKDQSAVERFVSAARAAKGIER